MKRITGRPIDQRADPASPADLPTFRDAFAVWARIGLLSFGGPAGQIALMHRVLVEERAWLHEREYLAALNFCMLLPGPEAMQLAAYAGWKLHGWRGGVTAGLLFVLPGAFVVLLLSAFYALFGQLPAVAALFFGIKAAVLAIVIEALIRVARRALTRKHEWWIAAAAFVALYLFAAPFPLVILLAALIGLFYADTRDARAQAPSTASWQLAARTAFFWLALWLIPLALIALMFGSGHVFTQLALFFSKLAVVTFGGAYAVLTYMAQQAVGGYGWLTAREMVDGLGLAETTPGPLILVTEFVGFLAGYRNAGGLRGGVLAAAITLWMTFVPCFLWVMTAAPYVEKVRNNARLSGALSGITAAVVGVILNLSLWFGLHVTFRSVTRNNYAGMQPYVPDIASLDFISLALSGVAVLALFRFKLGILKTLALCAALGALLRLL